jgi:hypothetical protein
VIKKKVPEYLKTISGWQDYQTSNSLFSLNIYPDESRLLNGPPVNRVEEDNPDKIIAPHGFQVIESYFFGDWRNKFYKQQQQK